MLNFWAIAFIAWGLVALFSTCRSGNRIWALGAIAAGVMMQTNTMHLTHFQMRNMWPLIIILVGVSALWHTVKEEPGPANTGWEVFRKVAGESAEGEVTTDGEIDMDICDGWR